MTAYILYGNPLSAPANKVRMCANALGIDYEYRLVNLGNGEQRTQEYLAINPYGKVPAIAWDNGKRLAESDAIIRFFADQVQSPLVPQEFYKKAQLDQWMCYASQHVGMAVAKIMFNTHVYKMVGAEVDPRSLADGKALLAGYLQVIESHLGDNHYLLGNSMSLADICFIALSDPTEVLAFDLSLYPRVQELRSEIAKHDFYRKCHTSYADMFEKFVSGSH
jgi:glutathione S-transferase